MSAKQFTYSPVSAGIHEIMLLVQMPVSSVWFIGFAIGVDLIVDGALLIGFATALQSLPYVAAQRAA